MQELLKTRKFTVVRKQVRASDGSTRDIDVVRHPGAVVVLPLLSADEVLMIRNFRHTLDRELWELPAGTLDEPGESPIDAAARELEEETGYRAGRIDPLGEFYPSPGFLNELIHAYVATDLTKTEQRLEPLEMIHVETVARDEAVRMAYDGRLLDAKSIITLLRWDWKQRTSR
ncbi:MAG: NUDIX hydrolase [Planctomycetes bacterium]|nr:NUDIX hydrolase [Planctomycetota bacterium]